MPRFIPKSLSNTPMVNTRMIASRPSITEMVVEYAPACDHNQATYNSAMICVTIARRYEIERALSIAMTFADARTRLRITRIAASQSASDRSPTPGRVLHRVVDPGSD